jgi:cell division protein FtsZ
MVLGQPEIDEASAVKLEAEKKIIIEEKIDPLAPKLVDEHLQDTPMPMERDIIEADHIKEEEPLLLWQLQEEKVEDKYEGKLLSKNPVEERETTVGKMLTQEKKDDLHSVSKAISISRRETPALSTDPKKEDKDSTIPSPAASGGYHLARPSNIYAESQAEVFASIPSAEKPVSASDAAKTGEDISELQMQLVERDIPAADMPLADHAQSHLSTEVEDPALRDEADEQKRRAAERLHKLRNLSFNVNSADPNNEFETVPAYIRRNMELYNSNSHIETFYSNYEVKAGKDNQAQISTINTFLDGKKPD